jgi:sec-independent protein translocase protein TatA
MPFNLSTGELVVLLLVAVILFGGRLPEVARNLGRTITAFKRSLNEDLRRLDRAIDTPTPQEPPPQNWRAPDGAECDGFGGPPPESTEPTRAEPAEAPLEASAETPAKKPVSPPDDA